MKPIRSLFGLAVSLLVLTPLLSSCGRSKAPTTATAKPVTITFWHGMSYQHKTDLDHLIRQFNHSQKAYKVVGRPQGNFADLQQKITAAAKAHTRPTMAQTSYTNVPAYVRGNFITPLDAELGAATLDTIVPAFRQSSRYQGKTYALPFSKSTRILYYNRDLLKQTGLSLPHSWETLQRQGKQLRKRGLSTIAFDQSFLIELDGLARQAGAPLVTNRLRVNLDTASTRAATHVIWDMLQDKTATTAGTDGYGSTQFFAGKTLFYSGSSAAIPLLEHSAPKHFHWGTLPLPSYRGNHAAAISGNDLVLFKNASPAQRKGAAAFMKFLIQKPQTIRWAEKSGYLPLTKAAQRDAGYRRYLNQHPAEKAAANSLAFGFQDPAFLGYPQYFAALNQAADKLATTDTTPEKTLPPLQKQVEQLVRQP